MDNEVTTRHCFRRFDRAMAAGLFQKQRERDPEVSSVFGSPSIFCMNQYEWDQTVNDGVDSYHMQLYVPLIQFAVATFVIGYVTLCSERVFSKLLSSNLSTPRVRHRRQRWHKRK